MHYLRRGSDLGVLLNSWLLLKQQAEAMVGGTSAGVPITALPGQGTRYSDLINTIRLLQCVS